MINLIALFPSQYDAVGWAPKEYNPDDKQSAGAQEQGGGVAGQNNVAAPQSGFVWDEASGYYYDAASGFYYDGNTGTRDIYLIFGEPVYSVGFSFGTCCS